MAIAGGAVPSFKVKVNREGEVIFYSFMFANGHVVVDDMKVAYDLVMNGESIFAHRYGYNYATLRKKLRLKDRDAEYTWEDYLKERNND